MKFVVSSLLFLGLYLATPLIPVAQAQRSEDEKKKEEAKNKEITELTKKIADAKKAGNQSEVDELTKKLEAIQGAKPQPGFFGDLMKQWYVWVLVVLLLGLVGFLIYLRTKKDEE